MKRHFYRTGHGPYPIPGTVYLPAGGFRLVVSVVAIASVTKVYRHHSREVVLEFTPPVSPATGLVVRRVLWHRAANFNAFPALLSALSAVVAHWSETAAQY